MTETKELLKKPLQKTCCKVQKPERSEMQACAGTWGKNCWKNQEAMPKILTSICGLVRTAKSLSHNITWTSQKPNLDSFLAVTTVLGKWMLVQISRRVYIQNISDKGNNITQRIKFTDKYAKYVTILIGL